MGSFSKQIPLNSDSSLGPVTIGSKIMVEKGKDPLPLEGGNVELVSGSGWDAGNVTITKQMNAANNKLDILVKLAPEIPLAHYISVILKKRPIKLKVTLFPRMLIPGMGVPVNVSGAPVTDDVDITIPGVPRPDIDLDVKFSGKTGSGSYHVLVTALLKLPPYISKKDREAVAKKITIDITRPKNVSIEKGELTPHEDGTSCELTATPEFTKKTGTPTVTIIAKASLPEIALKKEKLVSFEPQKNYILNISPGSLEVKKNKPASLTAQVLELMNGDQKVLVTDARLSIEGGSDLVSCSPDRGTGKFECRVSQQKVTGEKQVVLSVHASAGNDSVKPQTVPVSLETIDYGSLDVVFIPPEKDHLNPYIDNEPVQMKAKMVPPPGKDPVKADIEFTLENPGGWLKDVSTHAPSVDGDGSKDATFFGRIPDPGGKQVPPSCENVIFTATFEGTVIDELKVPVRLDPKPALTADAVQVSFLANAKRGRSGRPDAVTSAPVSLSVTNPGDGQWKISVEYSDIEKKMVSCKEKDKTSSQATFLFEISDDIPLPEQKPGVAAWQQVVEVATRATLSNPTMGDLTIDGPTIELVLLHEGIYPKSLYEYDKEGTLHDVTGKNKITYFVFDPSEKRAPLESVTDIVERHMFPYVTFEIWEWDGKGLVSTENHTVLAGPGQRSKDASPAGNQWDFIFFTLKDSLIEVIYSGEMEGSSQKISTGKWHIIFQKQIPGNGEKANGFVRFCLDGYYDPADHEGTINWQYELPLTLQLGSGGELEENLSYIVEGGRCEKIINKCFPEQHREKLRRELEALPCKGAKDLRFFSKQLHDRAYEIWVKENADYLVEEASWSRWINVAEKTSFAGDLAFNALVIFYTSGLSPYANFAVSNIASTIKSESIAVYAYYVEKGGGRDLPACIQAYVDENWVTFLANLASGEIVEPYLLRDFQITKVVEEPRKYGKILAWLWLWKFQFHLAEGIGKDDGGIIESAYQATTDIGTLALTVVLADFVNAHGTVRLKNLYGEVRAKGFFGGKEISPNKTDKGKKPDKGKPDKEKAPEKDKPDKEKPPEKEKPDKEKPPDKDKPDKEKPPDKKEPGKKDTEAPESHGKTEPPHKGTPLGKEYREFTYKEAPDADVGKLTKGMTEEHMAAAQRIAAEENVDLLVRSTTPYAEELIRTGRADPKPEYVKTKTIDANDLKLNPDLTEADLGKVGYFEPKPPRRGDFESGPKGDADFASVESRYKQRKQEFADQKGHIEEHSGLDPSSGQKLVVVNGKVKKVMADGTTRDITGDYDVFGVIDSTTGKPVTDPVKMERIYNRLKKEMNVQHPWQSQWDYRNEPRTVPDGSPAGAQAPYDVKRGIDQKIVGSHTKGNPNAEPLIRFGPDGKVTGAWITGVSGQ